MNRHQILQRRLGPVTPLVALSLVAVAIATWHAGETAAWAGDVDKSALSELAAKAQKDGGAPGLSAAACVGDQIVWSGGFGVADVEHQAPAKPETVYRIASISKPIAATALMQLVEQGKVSLDDPIQKYVPEFPEKREGPVLLRHLLTHTSGIRHYKPGEMFSMRHFISVPHAIQIFADDPLLFPPGTKFSYTTYGYNLLGGVVEKASGEDFGDYLQAHIFEPSGMSHSGLEERGVIVANRARPYLRNARTGELRNATYVDLSIKWAGGGMISTVEDLLRFHMALEAGKLLKPETLESMYVPPKPTDGSETTYGLGWNVGRDAAGRRFAAHSGGTTGGTSFLLRLPDEHVAVAVISNLEDDDSVRPLAASIAGALLGMPVEAAGAR